MDRRQFVVLLSAALGTKPQIGNAALAPKLVLGGKECSFCGRMRGQVRNLIAGPACFICSECIALCLDIVSDAAPQPNESPSWDFSRMTETGEGYFPPLEEMRGYSRSQIADLLRARGFAELDRFEELVDAVKALADGLDDNDVERYAKADRVTMTRDYLPAKLPVVTCSFCEKAQAEVEKIIAGPTNYICGECVALCNALLSKHPA